MIKKILSVLLVLLVSVSLFACSSNEDTEPTEATTLAPLPTVAVLSLSLDENTQKALDGFTDALSANGYTEDNSFKLVFKECKSEKQLSKAASASVEEKPALIYAIGSEAAKAAKKATSDIPVVFSCVDDPIGEGIVKSCEKPEANVTGVCDYSPVFEQIELIEALYPDVQRIGCLYNGADEESIFSANLASGEALAREIKFTMYPALTEDDFYHELDKALEKCDALYLTDDALVNAGLEETLKQAKKNKIPVFAESTELVEAGCLATCVADYLDIGYSAGELSVILLRSLKTVSQIPVEYATDCIPVINRNVQKSHKLTIDEDIMDKALLLKSDD